MMNSMKLQPDTSRITTQNPQIGGFSPCESSIFQPRPQPVTHDLPRGDTLPGSLQAEGSRTGGPEVFGGRRARLEICVPWCEK